MSRVNEVANKIALGFCGSERIIPYIEARNSIEKYLSKLPEFSQPDWVSRKYRLPPVGSKVYYIRRVGDLKIVVPGTRETCRWIGEDGDQDVLESVSLWQFRFTPDLPDFPERIKTLQKLKGQMKSEFSKSIFDKLIDEEISCE